MHGHLVHFLFFDPLEMRVEETWGTIRRLVWQSVWSQNNIAFIAKEYAELAALRKPNI